MQDFYVNPIIDMQDYRKKTLAFPAAKCPEIL